MGWRMFDKAWELGKTQTMFKTRFIGAAIAGMLWATMTLAQPAEDAPKAVATPAAVKKQRPRPLTDVESLLGRTPDADILWRRAERDLAYGLVEEAQRDIEKLLAMPDLDDKKLLELREKYGSSLLIRVQKHPELAKLAQPLLDRLGKASIEQARDPERIRYFIGKLDDSASERAYAVVQLNRSGPYAVPHYLEALANKRVEESALIQGLLSLPTTSWPAVAAALDSRDEGLISLLLDVLKRYAVPESADAIWYVAGNSEFSQPLREKARRVLAHLLGIESVPSPVRGLVDVAKRFERHEAGLGEPGDIVTVWYWKDGGVVSMELPVWQAEEFFGLRAARQALELDPKDREAKVTLLNLALEGSLERIGIEKRLPLAEHGAMESSLAAGQELMLEVLDRAIQSRRAAIALSAVRALADTANPNIIAGDSAHPSPLVQALNFPNSRVRTAAALAVLDVHPDQSFGAADRVVDSLVSALHGAEQPVALVIDDDTSRGNATSATLSALGYQTLLATTGKEGHRLARETQRVELIFIEPTIRDGDVLNTLEVFEADPIVSGIPTIVMARDGVVESLYDRAQEYPNVAVLPAISDAAKLGEALNTALPDRALIPWTEDERKVNRAQALDWLGRIARGELAYMDAAPAVDSLTKLLSDAEFGPAAADVLAFLPSGAGQKQLAIVALDGSLDPAVRAASAKALAKNLQRFPGGLDQESMAKMFTELESASDPALRAGLAAVVGCIDKEGKSAGERLRTYKPSEQ